MTVEGPDGRRTERYRAVLVANGHHWQPRWPEPAFPGAEDYEGEQLHVHHYREPDVLVGKRVLVLGIGNSAVDVAVESSRIADKTFLAMRRGAWVLPKFLGGKPIDEAAPPVASYLPIPVQRFFFNRMLKTAVGEMTDYGLPEPDHRLLEAHPTVSSELLPRIGHGDIAVKPNIERFAGARTVRFADGSEEQVDLVVYCTGYRIEFPFLDQRVFAARDNRMPLYRRVVSVESPGLYFVGFIQPLGPIMPLAEAQAEWVADLLTGEAALPPAAADARGDRRVRPLAQEALRRLEAAYDRGRLPPLSAHDSARAPAGVRGSAPIRRNPLPSLAHKFRRTGTDPLSKGSSRRILMGPTGASGEGTAASGAA